MSSGTAVVVGGGLAAAVGLDRIGWSAVVLEQAPASSEVGAGLSLWPNALRSLDALGVGEQVRASAVSAVSHGGTPDLGQGAGQAIEDAVVLAASLTRHDDPLTAIARYDEQRRPRTQAMARAAQQIHQLNARHFRTVLATARVMPPSLWRRQITRWTDWTPPAITRYASDRPGGESEKARGIS